MILYGILLTGLPSPGSGSYIEGEWYHSLHIKKQRMAVKRCYWTFRTYNYSRMKECISGQGCNHEHYLSFKIVELRVLETVKFMIIQNKIWELIQYIRVRRRQEDHNPSKKYQDSYSGLRIPKSRRLNNKGIEPTIRAETDIIQHPTETMFNNE